MPASGPQTTTIAFHTDLNYYDIIQDYIRNLHHYGPPEPGERGATESSCHIEMTPLDSEHCVGGV